VADGDSSGLVVVDISNPASPALAGGYNTADYANDVTVSGNYAYLADGWNGLLRLNISNPASPTLAGSYSPGNYLHGVTVLGNYLYIAESSAGLVILSK
jgi:hypothetical protein